MSYGTDIYLIDGDFMIGANGDLLILDEKKTLIQDVINRLKTVKGSYEIHPDYGSNIHRYVRALGDDETVLSLINEIEEELLKDPRIWEVDVQIAERTLKTLKLIIEVKPLEESPFNLVLSLEEPQKINLAVEVREV